MKLLYFAWLRQKLGRGEEEVEVPSDVTDVAGLVAWLQGRSAAHAAALGRMDVIRVAVNQEFAALDTPVAAGDEVAFFPPVTGG
ncbi:MAG: molybdopterin converting factor subunit 1 [Alphaproteobacteria bacterium]